MALDPRELERFNPDTAAPAALGELARRLNNLERQARGAQTIGGNLTVTGTVTSGGQPVVLGNDARLTDARTPKGAAGGDLGGTYPNPTLYFRTGTWITSSDNVQRMFFRAGAETYYKVGGTEWHYFRNGNDTNVAYIGGGFGIRAAGQHSIAVDGGWTQNDNGGCFVMGGTGSGERIWSNRGGGGADNYGISFATGGFGSAYKRGYITSSGELQWLRNIRQIQNQTGSDWSTADFEARGFNHYPRIALHVPGVFATQLRTLDHGAPGRGQYVNDAGNDYAFFQARIESQSDSRVKTRRRPATLAKPGAPVPPSSPESVVGKLRRVPVERFQWVDPTGKPSTRPHAGRGRPPREGDRADDGALRGADAAPHESVGFMAEDFHAAFPGLVGAERVGRPLPVLEDGTLDLTQGASFVVSDAVGILFAAVQELDARLDTLEALPRPRV